MQITRRRTATRRRSADARWLATNALDDKAFSEAATSCSRSSRRPQPLTADELLARARVLAEARRSDDALRAVERAGTRTRRIERASRRSTSVTRRAEAYYKARTRYPEAALAYRAVRALGGPRAAEDMFLSARAFSRADRDADALPAFAVGDPASSEDDVGRSGRVPRRAHARARRSLEGCRAGVRRLREALARPATRSARPSAIARSRIS